MARNTYGLDLGSYEIKVYDKQKDTIWKEKNVLARRNGQEIFAVGEEAYHMQGKVPGDIEITFPMKGGVISRFNDMQNLLKHLLKKDRQLVRGSQYVIAVPTDVTEVEKKAFFDLVIHSTARAREVNIVERAIADAVGLNLDVANTKGVMIVNFGAETTEISVLAGGGMVLNRLLKIGGATYDHAVISLIRHSHDFLVGRLTAEKLRKSFGIFTDEADRVIPVAGRDLITGVPTQKSISIQIVRAAMKDALFQCVKEITSLIDRTPPEVRKAIRDNGIFLTGGLSHVQGFETYIEEMVGIKTRTALDPDICAVNGLKKIIVSKELRELAYSMLDENYRWMR
ncbi:rod shape-determining protein [Clostridiaceae bacterium 68-1-5]|uniref:Rod shape-determining protein n=3 Tax=Suipraeoptans intestinalis TaxID=2606628 RepID=A0A6N7UZ62_9FIRM|nr:rod shape-determining protein [Suipraeoptans intestinalis]MDY3122104.1 rod shape-determining protein [Suipraeoptans intestinalis]MSR92866.1 rod shape-determining protein [Suipraeoptans intestinalis]